MNIDPNELYLLGLMAVAAALGAGLLAGVRGVRRWLALLVLPSTILRGTLFVVVYVALAALGGLDGPTG